VLGHVEHLIPHHHDLVHALHFFLDFYVQLVKLTLNGFDYVAVDYEVVMVMNLVDVDLILDQHNQLNQVVMEYKVNNVDVSEVGKMYDEVDF
jgi:hypothetical protein